MKCQLHQETIVDLARGVALPAAAEAAEAHMAECAQCKADLAREHELSAGLLALAASTEHVEPPAGLEARLLEAFDTLQRSHAEAGSGSLRAKAGAGSAVEARQWRVYGRALAAAASVVLVTGLAVSRLELTADPPAAPPAPARTPPEGPVAVSLTSVAIELLSQEVSRPGGASRASAETRIVFQEIPGASALPAFESARILRTELPVEALPAYGVEIVPDAVRRKVVLDLLVGQDGYARGVRVVPGAH
jgi:hypothetical protein